MGGSILLPQDDDDCDSIKVLDRVAPSLMVLRVQPCPENITIFEAHDERCVEWRFDAQFGIGTGVFGILERHVFEALQEQDFSVLESLQYRQCGQDCQSDRAFDHLQPKISYTDGTTSQDCRLCHQFCLGRRILVCRLETQIL